MKRVFEEISDDEWENHSFKPSRVLNKDPQKPSPPPIESFSYNSSSKQDDDDDCLVVSDDLEDDDADVEKVRPARRSRRFVIDDDEESDVELPEVVEVKSTTEDEEEEDEEGGEDEDDVVGKALQKCAKISAELRKELYGSSVAACDGYAEVVASSVKIVTQDDIEAACRSEDSDFEPVLKPYQLVGVNFLLLLHRRGIGGAILADEMGLGKTIQAITYLMLLKHLNDDPGPHLIVCPASVLENWERELKKWCPSFSVLQYHGSVRSEYAKQLNSLSKARLPPPFNVLLVCYSRFDRHSARQKDDRKMLKRWRWSCVLMDEAHALKDKNSHRWKNLMGVAQNANLRLMLTGTPLQNDLHVEYVLMEKQQADAYSEAIEEYRAASRARMAKNSDTNPTNVFGVLPRKQISSYFFQLRKIASHPLLVRRIYSDEDVVRFARRLYPMGAFGFECSVDKVIGEFMNYNDFSIHRVTVLVLVNVALPFFSCLSTKLNGQNYLEWAQSVKLVIDGRGKIGHLTGEISKPVVGDPHLKKWQSENSLVIAWLINSMEPTIGKPHLFLRTAREVWEAVRDLYSDLENPSQIFELKTQLWQSKQNDCNVTTYYNELVTCGRNLISAMMIPGRIPMTMLVTRKEKKTTGFTCF
ncbi:ATP-dependent helicase 1 [Morus notabilis]|uniref:ATP-dependent helicase 1 n=1 Tax=Morus notabilis TaxID=981085 RepID=W9RFP2_9ROSA|nr:ATP-dependent helicase 1 [Morus notabilis]